MKTQPCPLCKGTQVPGKTLFAVELGFGVVVVRDVPALVCETCGAEWIDDPVTENLENIISAARQRHHVVEVLNWQQEEKRAA